MRYLLAIIPALLLLSGCLEFGDTYTGLPPGQWKGVLEIEPKFITPNKDARPLPDKMNMTFEEVATGEVPFLFEIEYITEDSFIMIIQNGEERIVVDDITIGHDIRTAHDTIRIEFPVYDTYITGEYEGGVIEGDWVVPYKNNYSIPFVARYGQGRRFGDYDKPPLTDVSGKWAVEFGEGDEMYPAVAEFEQDGNRLTGTFRTETGDYRYLAGSVLADKLYLSVFDGSHAFVFEGKLTDEDHIVGSFRSGKHYRTTWTASRDAGATLPDPGTLTKLNEGFDRIDFTFPTPGGRQVSLSDARFAGKPKLIQILGTWCPNCRDETNFLKTYLEENPDSDVQVIGLAFERYRDAAEADKAIARYVRELDLPYPVLRAGYYDKKEAAEQLPMLDKVRSYPTLLFVDRDNRVQYIHTGFNGPATSKYGAFQEEFAEQLEAISVAPPS